MFFFDQDVAVPFLVFAIPLVAIAGGILAYIIKIISNNRLMEVVVRERMALVAKGLDPDHLPPSVAAALGGSSLISMRDFTRHRAQGLLVAGFVTLAGGTSYALVARSLAPEIWEGGDWSLGVIAASIGLALILSGAIIWPRGHHAEHRVAQRSG